MPNWLNSMQQTFEFYTVNPFTWKDVKRLDTVKSGSIIRDSSVETLGSASFDLNELVGESYVRAYLVTIQNGVRERFPLGTFLVQTPSSTFDGKVRIITVDAYTPLLELKENPPPLGYSLLKGENIMSAAYRLVRDHARAPVTETLCSTNLYDDFVSNSSDTWMTFLIDLIERAKYHFELDELGRILFAPEQKIEALQPVWTYNDDNSSILYADVSLDHDIYNIPNVVEVIYSNGTSNFQARVVNDDINSPTSTVNRGREITHRESNPELGNPTDGMIEEYARRRLKELSSVEYTVSYTHAYCPVRLGDCVRLNYRKAGLSNIKAKVIYQSIKLEPGCPVSEKAVYTTTLWG